MSPKPCTASLYDAISTDNPKLSEVGKTILITGGGTTIGNAIGRSFVRALAETVIILGRRLEVLQEGALRLEQEAKAAGMHTTIIHRQLDITDFSAVDAFWKQLASEGIAVDVFVSNAAAFPQLKPVLESAVTTKLAAYAFNKSCGTMLFQMVAKDTSVEEMQITSMHPGVIWSPEWVKMGFKDDVGFDNNCISGYAHVTLRVDVHGDSTLIRVRSSNLVDIDLGKSLPNPEIELREPPKAEVLYFLRLEHQGGMTGSSPYHARLTRCYFDLIGTDNITSYRRQEKKDLRG
ncbi:peroxisomal short-chain alcohol dehydrogenase [Fusarium agapanthi]|uniref:Peroxisomal short-chain alcohol dehydrogenase n=1 Tax=Fusarium agapanthi TaxID=1803897 RepID=A0A9P5BLL3_9HYPO|nr:peroxisomal short-chain alcohol dehydrogenase [Fusarium agapanthi]